jgi:hypothetical protein
MKQPPEPTEVDGSLINLGVAVGVYLITSALADGVVYSREGLRRIADSCADDIHGMTDIPAEDFCLSMQPVLDDIMKAAKENSQ